MKQLSSSDAAFGIGAASTEVAGPKGIGMAVAFDWGFATQLLITPYFPFLVSALGFIKQPSFQLPTAIITLVLALAFFALGEGVRSGVRWTRIVQIVWNAVVLLGGLGIAVVAIGSIGRGNYWSLVPALIILIACPLILWRITRPVTAQWFKSVSSVEARRRHGGAWPFLILLWSVVGGILVATSALFSAR